MSKARDVMGRLYAGVRRLFAEEHAPTMAEYGLLLIFIALLVVGGGFIIGTGISTFFSATGSEFAGATIPTIP
jgi:Flp pilus assembly pilin Flp